MSTFLRPFTHINYLNEYLNLQLNHYAIEGPRYFCTYYKFDLDNSSIDDRPYVQNGNYHLVDEKSGRKWKKIHLMPLWLVEGHGPVNYQAREDGVVREVTVSFVMPDYMGVRPNSRDFIHLYDNISNKPNANQPLYMVQNRNESQMGKREVYKIECKNTFHLVTQLDVPENIASEWIYVNHFRKIFTYDAGHLILSTLSENFSLFDTMTKDESTSFAYDTNVCMFNVKYRSEKTYGYRLD